MPKTFFQKKASEVSGPIPQQILDQSLDPVQAFQFVMYRSFCPHTVTNAQKSKKI
mgnify:CR=1 FL=1